MTTPTYAAQKLLHVNERDAGINKSIGRISHRRIDPSGTHTDRFHRRQPMAVTNNSNGLTTVLFAMGAPEVPLNAIAFDYDARLALGLKYKQNECDLEVRPATQREVMRHYLSHADMGLRLSMQLGLLGAALGALSFADTLITLFGRVF